MTTALLAGLGFGLSLIVAVGPQNAYVLRQGALRDRVGLVIVLCATSDMLLIAAGVGGMGGAIQAVPWLVEVMRWLGAAVVLGYGLLAAVRALRGTEALTLPDDDAQPPASPGPAPATASQATTVRTRSTSRRLAVTGTTLALTWLNPHVYLDTLVLMGGVGSTYGDLRWWFAAGAIAASWAWFAAIGLGAARLSHVLARPAAWRVLDGAIAVIMLTVAAGLVLGT
ncbi:LysE/ArgO family amino acid transporter [Myceligenerans cantabricum]